MLTSPSWQLFNGFFPIVGQLEIPSFIDKMF